MPALDKRLEIGGQAVALAGERVTLELGAVGRGTFSVRGLAQAPGQVWARYLLGIRGQGTAYPVLQGVVAEAALSAPDLWTVTVREPCALLSTAATFALRHITPRDVLRAIEDLTGLSFLLPASGAYLTRRLPHFAGAADCRAALEAMGPSWGLSDAVWSGLPDGRVYWGRWEAGPWGAVAIALDPALIVSREARALVLPALPGIRPGVLVRDAGAGTDAVMVQRAEFSGTRVRIEWGDV